LVVLYPDLAKKIPPAVLQQMTADDVDRIYKEHNEKANRDTLRGLRGSQLDQQKLGKDMDERDQLDANLAILEDAVNNPDKGILGPDVPGAGRWDSRKPDEAASQRDLKVRQAARGAASGLIYALSGKAASDQERQFIMKAYGIQEGGSEAGFIVGVKRLAEDARRAQRGLAAKYAPEVVERYKKQREAAGLPPLGSGAGQGQKRYVRGPDGNIYEEVP
jgi:hypothetical protein